MGFFDFFKKEKQGFLSLPDKYNSSFIQPLSVARLEIKLGDHIVVPQGWWAVIVVKDKPRDVFEAGEWIISLDRLPLTKKALRLDKPVVVIKKGKKEKVYRESFKCDLYYVSQATFTDKLWQSDNVNLKLPNKKRYSVGLGGTMDFRCVEPSGAIKLFLYEWARIESIKAEERLREFVGEIVTEILPSIKGITPQAIDDREVFEMQLLPLVNKSLSKYGITLDKLNITKTDFSLEIAAQLEQEKMEKDIASDELNELGAEISVADERAIKETRKPTKKVLVNMSTAGEEVLDMTSNDTQRVASQGDFSENVVANNKEKASSDAIKKEKLEQGEESDFEEELPKVVLDNKHGKDE